MRVYGAEPRPVLVYLPGLHGDSTLVQSFRAAVLANVRFVEVVYPRTSTWLLADYAQAVLDGLSERGITRAWLLAESFSSQVAWEMLRRAAGAGEISPKPTSRTEPMNPEKCGQPVTPFSPPKGEGQGMRCGPAHDRQFQTRVDEQGGRAHFQAEGLILAGGFVRHPMIWGVHLLNMFHRALPWWFVRLQLKIYAAYARLRLRRAPETLASIPEFLARRTQADWHAMACRYPLVAGSDFRVLARSVSVPLYQLSGFFDPIVPWPLVRRWLRRNCPALRDACVIGKADHMVLATAPEESARRVLAWMGLTACEKATSTTSARR